HQLRRHAAQQRDRQSEPVTPSVLDVDGFADVIAGHRAPQFRDEPIGFTFRSAWAPGAVHTSFNFWDVENEMSHSTLYCREAPGHVITSTVSSEVIDAPENVNR